MNNIELIASFGIAIALGIAIGMYYEHQRFVKEIQGLSKKHADEPASTAAVQPEAVA